MRDVLCFGFKHVDVFLKNQKHVDIPFKLWLWFWLWTKLVISTGSSRRRQRQQRSIRYLGALLLAIAAISVELMAYI